MLIAHLSDPHVRSGRRAPRPRVHLLDGRDCITHLVPSSHTAAVTAHF
jgi:hypothetical protein